MPVVLPSFIVGIGATGIRCVGQLAPLLAQTYADPKGVSLAAIDLECDENVVTPLPVDTGLPVSHYVVTADIDDWLRYDDQLAQLPDTRGWLHLPLHRSSWRQRARLVVLKHLHGHIRTLDNFFTNTLQTVTAAITPNSDSLPTTYILVGLDDLPAQVMTPDIINLIQRAFRRAKTGTRIILYLALPTLSANAAACFATLRELERYMMVYQDVRHNLYPPQSPLAAYNPAASHPVYMTKIYQAGDTPEETAQQWVDLLLPQLDGNEKNFGVNYLQHNMVNWQAWRDTVMTQAEASYVTVVGTYAAHSAIFPAGALRQYYRDQLTYDALSAWLGPDFKPTEARRILEQEWLTVMRYDADGEEVSCPASIRWLLNITSHHDLIHLDAQTLIRYMVQSEGGHALLSQEYERYRPTLQWQPSFETISDTSSTTFVQSLQRQIRQKIGRYEPDLTALPDGAFVRALTPLLDIQIERYRDSLWLFFDHLLAHHGIRSADVILRGVLQPALAQSQTHIIQAARIIGHEFDDADYVQTFSDAARQLKRVRNVFGQPGDAAQQTMNYAVQLAAQLQNIAVYHVLQTFVAALDDALEPILTLIDGWRDALWHGDDALLEQAQTARRTFALSDAPYRYWLYDEKWGDNIYAGIRNRYLDEARQLLRWQRESASDRVTYQTTPDSAHRLTLWLQVANRPAQRLSAASATTARSQNLRDWQRAITTLLADMSLDMWSDFLLANERYRAHIRPLQQFLSTVDIANSTQAYVTQDYLLMPDDMRKNTDNDLVTALTDGNLTSIFTNSDETRIVRFATAEGFALHETSVYRYLQGTYQRLDRRDQQLLHILAPEVSALQLEEDIETVLGQQVSLSPFLTTLLERTGHIEYFVRLHALGIIRILPFDKETNAYALTHEDKQWWLSRGSFRPSLLEALVTFCFTDEGQTISFGHNGVRALPTANLYDQWIETTLTERATQRTPPYPEGRVWRWVETLETYRDTRTQIWAKQTAEAAQILMYYQSKSREHRQQQADDAPSELHMLLELIAERLIEAQQNALIKRLL